MSLCSEDDSMSDCSEISNFDDFNHFLNYFLENSDSDDDQGYVSGGRDQVVLDVRLWLKKNLTRSKPVWENLPLRSSRALKARENIGHPTTLEEFEKCSEIAQRASILFHRRWYGIENNLF